MVNPVLSPDPTVLRAVSIAEIAGGGQLMPALAVGEVARIVVRQAQQEGMGLILLKGQLVKAALPQNVKAGDTLLAQVADNTDQLLFKILDVVAGETEPAATPPVSARVAADLKQLTNTPGAPGLRPLQPFSLPVSLPEIRQELELSKTQLNQLFKAISTTEDLADAKTTLDKLLSTTDGSMPATLKQAAQSIRAYVEKNTPEPAQRLIHLVRDELFKLLESADKDNRSAAQTLMQLADMPGAKNLPQLTEMHAARTLMQLTEMIDKEVKEAKRGPEKDALRATLKELDRREGGSAPQREQIEKALHKLETALEPKDAKPRVDAKTLEELKHIAVRLEQMAATQETLNQLNPVMQALGEPALILLPFLFQGLISHSEVTIDTQVPGKKKGDANEHDGGSKKRSESYHRIQVNVPLPSLGSVAVDIAHKEKEIMVRMTVESQEAGSFLLEQLEHLAIILKEQGFQTAELVAHVGVRRESVPAWTLGLHAATSVLA